jgi:hypothetical protein
MILRLRSGAFQSADGQVTGTYTRGEDESGSYLVFEPALHLRTDSVAKDDELIVASNLPRNHLPAIERKDRIGIRIPTEPVGEGLLEQRPCARRNSPH